MNTNGVHRERKNAKLFDRRDAIVDVETHDDMLRVGISAARVVRQLEMKIAQRVPLDQARVGRKDRTRNRGCRPSYRIGLIENDMVLVVVLPQVRSGAGVGRRQEC